MTTSTITGTSTMQEILTAYPAAQRALFKKYHIGGCSSCGFQPTDQLQTVLQNHGCKDSIPSVIAFLQESQAFDDKTKITIDALKQLIDKKVAVKVVDMRQPYEVAATGAIPGALPLTQELAQELQHSWPKDTKVVLYCQSGMRSADAVAFLAGHGFTDIWSLGGGFHAWSTAGLPTLR